MMHTIFQIITLNWKFCCYVKKIKEYNFSFTCFTFLNSWDMVSWLLLNSTLTIQLEKIFTSVVKGCLTTLYASFSLNC